MKIRNYFVANSSSSSFIVTLPKGTIPSIELIIPDHINTFLGFSGRSYSREEVFNFFIENFDKVDFERVLKSLNYEHNSESSKQEIMEHYSERDDLDFYIGEISDHYGDVFADLEQCIFPGIADMTFNHH